jgi:hypothetical protein
MKLFITSSPEAIPRYSNFTFHRIGKAAAERGGWQLLLLRRHTAQPLDEQLIPLKAASTVVLTSEIMNMMKGEYQEICTRSRSRRRLRRVMFLSDVHAKNLARVRIFDPHATVSLSGHLLAIYKSDPRVYIPHPGLDLPFNASPQNTVYVPEYNFVRGTKRPYLREFYAARQAMSWTMVKDKRVVFQLGELVGPDYFKAIGKHLVGVSTIPSDTVHFLPAKFWEIMSAGALLLAYLGPLRPLFESLGFHDGVHYLACDTSNVLINIAWALEPTNRKLVDKIRLAGYNEVRKRHMPVNRVEAIEDFC